MYEEILKIVKKRYGSNVLTRDYAFFVHVLLLYVKFLCDKGVFKLDDIIDSDFSFLCKYFEDNDYGEKFSIFLKRFSSLKVCHLLKYLKDDDLKSLTYQFITEMFGGYEISVVLFEGDILYMPLGSVWGEYLPIRNDYLFKYSSVVRRYIIYCYKLLDEILEIKNNYFEDVDFSLYDTIYITDNFRNRKSEKIYEYIKMIYKDYGFKGKVILKTYYNKVSKFSDSYILRKLLNRFTILNNSIQNPEAILEFSFEKVDEIAIISLDNFGLEDFRYVLENDDEKKIVVSKSDIIKNNYLIGYSMYKKEITSQTTDIIKVTQDNSHYMRMLYDIDKDIEGELLKLIAK